MRTQAQWLDMAEAHIARGNGMTDTQMAAHRRDTAAWCFAAEQAGVPFSLWHGSSLVNGHRCQCAPCALDRAQRAVSDYRAISTLVELARGLKN